MAKRILYAQSGGMSAVINASAAGVISQAQKRGATVLAARFGMQGVLAGDIVTVPPLDHESLMRMSFTPGGIFGTARRDLPEPEEEPDLYDQLFAQFERFEIDSFLYNGGNGSIYTVAQIARESARRGAPIQVVGIPKTIDNDLVGTYFSPGFPSAARYLATSFLEASLDLASFPAKGARAFVMETMGRNSGWLAASVKTAATVLHDDSPHLILLPEMRWSKERFLAEAQRFLDRYSYCTVVVAEGVKLDGAPLSFQGVEQRRYIQLGGAGSVVGGWLREELGAKVHVAVPDYLQRAAAHWLSAVDRELAWQVGETAVAWVCDDPTLTGVMVGIAQESGSWEMRPIAANEVGNRERPFPREWLDEAHFRVTEAFLDYLLPLLEGCPVVPCGSHGLPRFLSLSELGLA